MDLHIKDVPHDIFKYILKKQGEVKEKKLIGQFSQSKTICMLLKEHKELLDSKIKA